MSRDFQIPWPPSSVYDRVPIVPRNSEVAAFTKDGWLRLASAGDPSGQFEIRDASIDATAIVRTDKTNGAALVQTQNDARAYQVGIGPDDAFRVYDLTGTKSVFTIEPGAPDYSLYVDSSGLLGVGTNAPGYLGHFYVSTGNPDLAVETGSATGQAGIRFINSSQMWRWHVNSDGNCHLRDVTGAANPFQVQPGAPTSSFYVDSSGNVGLGTSSPTETLDVNGDAIRIRTSSTPASASATGATGEIRWDSSCFYVCTGTDTWKRVAIATW